MGCEMGRSLRGFASVVVSAIMTRALLLLGIIAARTRGITTN